MNILCGMIRVWCFKLWNCRQALRAALLELLLKCQQAVLWNKTEGYTSEEIVHSMRCSGGFYHRNRVANNDGLIKFEHLEMK